MAFEMSKKQIIAEKNASVLARKKTDDIVRYLGDKARAGDEVLLQMARERGINVDSLKGAISHDVYAQQFLKQVGELVMQKNEIINNWVKSGLEQLRSLYIKKSFKAGKESIRYQNGEPLRNNSEIETQYDERDFDKLSNTEKSNVLALRGFLDTEGLTFLYREAEKPSYLTEKYGMSVANVDWNTPVDQLNIDFSSVTDKELGAFYTGTRVKDINKKIEQLGYSLMNGQAKFGTDSEGWKNGGRDFALTAQMEKTAANYVQRTYGMEFTYGKNKQMFSWGNQKIMDDTLIINFTAAMRCPAWNECLLKDACYARVTERNYGNTLNRNLRNNLIWEQTKEDPTLMQMMLELVRSYFVDYAMLAKKIKPKEADLFSQAWSEVSESAESPKVTAEELCKLTFADIQSRYGDEAIELIKKTKRGNLVRLNEDGDFIGQWLVDAWDKWAGDFKIIGVNVACYTCRALNYEKVQNLIINVSQEALTKGQKTNAVAHYFYAVEPNIYEELRETYNGENYGLVIGKDGKITPVYRNILDDQGNLIGYYYKCPCGRGKYNYEPIDKEQAKNPVKMERVCIGRDDSPNFIEVGGAYYKKEKNKDFGNKVDCYRCRICYGRDAEENIVTEDGRKPMAGVPVYVFVAAHGANKQETEFALKSKDGGRYDPRKKNGRTAVEWALMQQRVNNPRPYSNEAVNEMEQSDPLAIKQIVKNSVNSVAEHMREKKSAISEQRERFFSLLDRMNKK